MGAANLLGERRAVCEAAGILTDGDVAGMKMDDLRKALVLLQDYLDDMPVAVLLKVTHRVLTDKIAHLVSLREKAEEFEAEACDFVTALLPVSPTATMFDVHSPTFHGLVARVVDSADLMEEPEDAGSDDEGKNAKAKKDEAQLQNASLALQEPGQLSFCNCATAAAPAAAASVLGRRSCIPICLACA